MATDPRPDAGPAVEIYTDGACKGNPGIGGWGALLRYGHHERELSGAVAHGTNNQMELTAAVRALGQLTRPCRVRLTTDSTYVKNGITSWLASWKRNGWRTATKAPVKNQELWQELDALCQRHRVEWHWVKGHSGHPENERVDALANAAIARLRAGEDTD